MSEATASSPERRLLVGGEHLRMPDVVPPRTGGGPKFDPQTPEEARRVLLPQVDRVVSDAATMSRSMRLPGVLYVEAKLLPNYLAPSYFPNELLNEIGAVAVGARADIGTYRTRTRSQQEATRRVVFAISDSGLQQLRDLVASGGRTRTEAQAFDQIRRIEEIALPSIERVLRMPQATVQAHDALVRTWEAVLHPRTAFAGEPKPLAEADLEAWFRLTDEVDGHVFRDYVRSVAGLTFVPISIQESAIGLLARFNALRVLRPMPAIRPRPRFGTRSVRRLSPAPTRSPVADTVAVAVFDGGLDPRGAGTALFPVRAIDLTPEAADADELDHGTGVTAAVLYGLVEPGDAAPQAPLPVDTFRVMPPPVIPGDLEGYWVLDRIKETLSASTDYRLVNLSLGPTTAVEEDSEPNRWTSELDQIAWENDILFVVAAGNDGDLDQATGLHRVQVPADMANGLGVGACDAPSPEMPWQRAPYSSQGPGRPGNRVQPAGVQFGGVDTRLFDVVRYDGTFLEATGTSFAAPVTTHALAELVTRLPRVNASVLRSFAVHFAERPRRHVALVNEVGYGRHPLSYLDRLDCGANEEHVLYVDEIQRTDTLAYRLPVPSGWRGRLRLRVTLAYASSVDPTQPSEYTNASLGITFRPHQFMYTMSPPRGSGERPVVMDRRDPEVGELLANGWSLSQEPATRPLGGRSRAPEWELRDSGKWETVRHHVLTIDGLEVDEPRFELNYVSRRAGAIDRAPTRIPFALLLSIEDVDRSGDLYDRAVSEFAMLRPVPRVRGRLRLRGAARSSNWY